MCRKLIHVINIKAGLIVGAANVSIKDLSTLSYQVISTTLSCLLLFSLFLNLLFSSPSLITLPLCPLFPALPLVLQVRRQRIRSLQTPTPQLGDYTLLLMRDKMGLQSRFDCNTGSIVDTIVNRFSRGSVCVYEYRYTKAISCSGLQCFWTV